MTVSPIADAPAGVADTGRIRVGAGYRLPSLKPALADSVPARPADEIADTGRIRMGAGYRLPTLR